jgi:hypothetical protein
MHGPSYKIVKPQQAKLINNYKNTRLRSGYNIINKYIQSLMYLDGFNSFNP